MASWGPSTGEGLIEGAILLVGLAVALVSAFGSQKIAEAKGHNGSNYFVLGLFLPIIGLLVAGFMPEAKAADRDEITPSDCALTDLRPHDDQEAQRFIAAYQASLRLAHLTCESGERVLAYGIGVWDTRRFGADRERGWTYRSKQSINLVYLPSKWAKRDVVFLLTDRQLLLVALSTSIDVSTVNDLTYIRFDEATGALVLNDGALTPGERSPFTAVELESLMRGRDRATPFVEVIIPGDLSLPVRQQLDQPSVVEKTNGLIGELERLDSLHQSGAIDDAEFAELKRRAMWGEDRSP